MTLLRTSRPSPSLSPFSLRSNESPNPFCHLISHKPGWGWAVASAVLRRTGAILAWVIVASQTGAAEVAGATEAAEVAGAPVADEWSVKAPEFQANASIEGAPTVLYFTATWCGYCRQMERTTLSNGSVKSWLEPFGRIKLDYDEQSELVKRYQIRGVPAFVMVNARGEEISRLVGMTEPDPFRGWLEDGKVRLAEMVKAAAERQAELKLISERLSAGGANGWDEAKTRIFELAARGDPESREFALNQLAARAAMKPSMLFDGLLHPDLAVRLAVSGVLRKTLGDRFVFDPWADAKTREEVVQGERFAMLADVAVSVVVSARFVTMKKPLPADGALAFLTQAKDPTPGAVVGMLTSEQAGAVFAALDGMKDVISMTTPTVTVGAGNPANVQIGQEMRYPIRWEKSPDQSGWMPADFETRTVGGTLVITPQVHGDGAVGLSLTANSTEFEGFIEFGDGPEVEKGRPKTAGDNDASSVKPETSVITLDGKGVQLDPQVAPVFFVREVTTELLVPAGRTAVVWVGKGRRISWLPAGVNLDEKTNEENAITVLFVTASVKGPFAVTTAR